VNKYLKWLFCLFYIFSNIAIASAPITTQYWARAGIRYTDPSAYCMGTLQSGDNYSGYKNATYNPNTDECTWLQSDGSVGRIFRAGAIYESKCSDGTAPDTTKPLDKQCVAPEPFNCPAASVGDQTVTRAWATGSQSGSAIASRIWPNSKGQTPQDSVFCNGKCQVKPSAGASSCHISQVKSPNGYYAVTCDYPMVGLGGACGGSEPSLSSGEPTTVNKSESGGCPANSVPAGQDSSGMTICAGTKVDTTPKTEITGPKTTTTDANGNSVTKQDIVKSNSDGSNSTTTTTTTTKPDGTSTTVINTVTGNKPSGDAGTPDKPDTDLCKQNPELTICKNSQVLGKCAEVTCTGDAIQCATLRAASAMECRDKDDRDQLEKSGFKTTGDAILSGNDPMKAQADALWKGTSVDLSSQNLDQSGFIGGGSCFPNKTFNVAGKQVTMSFTSICSNIQALRYAFLAIGFIVAYLTVSKSVLQS
jgi:hypothetical protein